jgi:hypothetical protein
VFAEPFFDARALAAVPWLLGFSVLAALTGEAPGSRRRWRPWALGAALAGTLLALLVFLRGPVGLQGEILGEDGQRHLLAPGPIDATPADLGAARGPVLWQGALRAPRSGTYRLWARGRGKLELRLDESLVLSAEGEDLDAGAEVPIGRGEHRLALRYERTGNPEMRAALIRGHRLRVGWVPPRASGAAGATSDWIPPRHLGPARPAFLWIAIDVLALALAAIVAGLVYALPWERRLPLPSPGPMTRPEWTASLLGYAVVLAVMSWPLLRDPAGHGIADRADGQLSVWLVAWDAHVLATGPGRLFDAPIFHPAKQALAFSENMWLPALLAAPATLLGGPVLGYNLVFLFGALVSGVGVQLLVRRVSGDRFSAFVAGVLYAAGAQRWTRIVHLHEQFTPFLPLALLALERFWERRTLRRALLVGLALALQAMASIYLGVILATLLGLLMLLALVSGLRAVEAARLALGLAFTGVLVLPLVIPYLQMRERYGAEWSLAAVEPHALTLPSYLASGTRLYAGVTARHQDPDERRRPLFPGVVTLALGIAGLARAPRRYRVAAIACIAAAVLLSLGPATALYRLLYEHVLLFRGLRGVFRFGVIPVLLLCGLAGLALAGRRRLAVAALLLGLAESASFPLRLGPYAGPSETARWLAAQPGAAVYLPMGEREDARTMLDEIPYFKPLLNGYSSFTPPHYRWLPDLLETPLSDEALQLLRAFDARHVASREELALPLVVRFGDTRVYAVPPGPQPRAAACPEQGDAALWQDQTLMLDLGRARSLMRVRFELGDEVPQASPQAELSSDGRSFRAVTVKLAAAGAVLALAESPRRACAELLFEPAAEARFVRLRGIPVRWGSRAAAE